MFHVPLIEYIQKNKRPMFHNIGRGLLYKKKLIMMLQR
jgi:hypothetical protein